jgi:hypothetical protein
MKASHDGVDPGPDSWQRFRAVAAAAPPYVLQRRDSAPPAARPSRHEANRQTRSRLRRTIFWIAALALIASVALAGYLRYTSTTCQLRRAFGVAGWTCGHLG